MTTDKELEDEIIKEVNTYLATKNGKDKYDKSREMNGMEKLICSKTIQKTIKQILNAVDEMKEKGKKERLKTFKGRGLKQPYYFEYKELKQQLKDLEKK